MVEEIEWSIHFCIIACSLTLCNGSISYADELSYGVFNGNLVLPKTINSLKVSLFFILNHSLNLGCSTKYSSHQSPF